MTSTPIQVQLFQYLKNKIPPQSTIVDEVAAILDISTDSAYRRIRGDKPLNLEEVQKLCMHYKISLDHLLNLQSDAFLFVGNFLNPHSFQYDAYLSGIVQQLKYMASFKEKSLIYLAKDIPLFHHFHFRELAAFKYYFWMKNILQTPEFARKKFKLDDYPDEYFQLGQKMLSLYNQFDSIELWNIESINSTIRQIEYYHDSNIFSSKNEIIAVYEALEKLIIHLEQQATEGIKFDVNDPEKKKLAGYQMYFNEILILEGHILALLDGSKTVFIIHNVLNILRTNDVRFCDNMHEHIQNLIKKSTLISTVSEKERSRFFNYLRNRIQRRKNNLKL